LKRVESETVYTVEGNFGNAAGKNTHSIGRSVIYGCGTTGLVKKKLTVLSD